MAPTAPKKRPSIRAKTSKAGSGLLSRPASFSSNSSSSKSPSTNVTAPSKTPISFSNSKKDKHLIKHSAFISRIEKSRTKPLKRRRPSKKLVTTLNSLADALPDIESLTDVSSSAKAGNATSGLGKSLKSKPGALKRKEKLERGERERFGRNLAVIMGSGSVEVDAGVMEVEGQEKVEGPSAAAGRLRALRAWVGANMEKNPAFEKKG